MDLKVKMSWNQLAQRLICDLTNSPHLLLPGIRTLQKQYGVTRLTIERTLQHLEELEILTPAQLGKKREINHSRLKKIATQHKVKNDHILFIVTDALCLLAYTTRKLQKLLYSLCEQENLHLDQVVLPSKETEIRALLMALNPRGIILFNIVEPIEKLVCSLNVPTIGIGTHFYRVPSYYYVYGNMLCRAIEQAMKFGHRRISAPFWNVRASNYAPVAEVVETFFKAESIPFSEKYNLPRFTGTTSREFYNSFFELFRYTPPTCVILYDLSHYLAFSSFLLKKGLRIPDDISIILLSEDPMIEEIFPTLAHFIRLPEGIVRKSFRLLLSEIDGLQIHEQTEFVPTWVPGDSLSTPKKSCLAH